MQAPLADSHWREKQHLAEQFQAMADGNFGSFYDALSTNCVSDETLFPRLTKLLQQKKHDWSATLPVCTNYFRAICQVITDFSLGEGIRFAGEKDEAVRAFSMWWDQQNLDRLLHEMTAKSIATGTCGLQLSYDEDGTILPQLFGLPVYFPAGNHTWGYTHNAPSLGWIIKNEDETLLFQHIFTNSKNGHFTHTVRLNEYNESTGSIGKDVTESHKNTSDLQNVVLEYPVLPLVLMHSPRRGNDGIGVSFFHDILSQVQTLCFLDTVASIELQTHFLSKLAIPRSLVSTDPAGRPTVKPMEYIVYEDDAQIPQFIQKDNKFFEDLIQHSQTMKESISLSTGIPFEILSKEGKSGEEKVELAQIRQRPFRQVIRSWQRVLRHTVQEMYTKWCAMNYGNNIDMGTLQILLPDGFSDIDSATRAVLLDEFRNGIISHKRYVQLTNPDLSDDEVTAVVQDAIRQTPTPMMEKLGETNE